MIIKKYEIYRVRERETNIYYKKNSLAFFTSGFNMSIDSEIVGFERLKLEIN